MFSKESQYVNILKYDNQLKVDNKILKNENLEKTDESTFIIYDEILSKDIALKINQWQKDIPNTYLTTLCLCDDEKIINKTNKKLIDYKKAYLNTSFDVVVKTSKLFEVQHYFEFTGLDYVFSPFQVLNQHLEQNPTSNSLIVLTVSNYVYIIIVNSAGRIVYNKVFKISEFNDIKDSRFYENDLTGQKLFDEIYSLELQDSISKTLKEYYEKKSGNFVEKIDILYTIKQLSDEQIQQLEDDLLIDVHYHYVSLKDSLYELSRGTNSSKQSFVKSRVKKSSPAKKWFIFMLVLISLIIVSGVYFQKELSSFVETIKEEFTKDEISSNESKEPVVPLPNHINENDFVLNDINVLLKIIPFDMVLTSLQITKNDSTIKGKMLTPDSYIKDIRPNLLKYYKESEIQVEDSKKVALNIEIKNTDKIIKSKDNINNNFLPKYKNDGFMPVIKATDILLGIMPQNTVLNYDNTFKLEISTYNYKVKMQISTPKEFFDFVEVLKKQNYSMNISYPVEFIRSENNSIEVGFGLQFHQNL